MSQITADKLSVTSDSPMASRYPAMNRDNITLPKGAFGVAFMALLVLGLAGLGGVAYAYFAVDAKHAIGSWMVGAFSVLGIALGGLFFTLVFHLTNAGWSALLRRQFENAAAMIPLACLLIIPILVAEGLKDGLMYKWLGPAFEGDYLLGKKKPFLTPMFFFVASGVYMLIWSFLAWRLNKFTSDQDATGDRWISLKANRFSTIGMIVFALTTAFAAFHWLMSLDYRFFSTMWGVYFFAGSAFAGVCAVTLILSMLRDKGKLKGVLTEEHFHDLGKLVFSFSVFWAYIAFSQYFLIWYSNIPEETAWFLIRRQGMWNYVFIFLCLGHFVLPFLFLLSRHVKRNPRLLATAAALLLFVHAIDIFFIVRPMVTIDSPALLKAGLEASTDRFWIDGCALVGAFGIFFAFLLRRIASRPLVPLADPRTGEALEHKNYV